MKTKNNDNKYGYLVQVLAQTSVEQQGVQQL